MIYVRRSPNGLNAEPRDVMSFHGRDYREFSVHHDYRSHLPDVITITISNNVREYGVIQFRGVDCSHLINGILDEVNTRTLKQIMLGITDRLEERAKRP